MTKKFHPYKSPEVDEVYPVLLQKDEKTFITHMCCIFKACIVWRYKRGVAKGENHTPS